MTVCYLFLQNTSAPEQTLQFYMTYAIQNKLYGKQNFTALFGLDDHIIISMAM